MITWINQKTLPRTGRLYIAQFHLRHECFIERQDYNVKQFDGMEFDQYDTPAAAYLVYGSPSGRALGCSRLTPVHMGSMIKDLWPDIVREPEMLEQSGVWEATRFCVRKSLPPALRRQIARELVFGYFEYGLQHGIRSIVGVMPPVIMRSVFGSLGCRYTLLGAPKVLESGERIVAGSLAITEKAFDELKQRHACQLEAA